MNGEIDSSAIAANLAQVRAAIAAACQACGREPASVELVAVSKLQPAQAVRAAYQAGQRDFGENYGQELRDKAAALQAELPDIRWHFIGPIQSNKVRYLAGCAHAVHTVDRFEVAQALMERATRVGRAPALLVEINIGREPQKSGVLPEQAPSLLTALQQARIGVRGLMAMPPVDEPVAQAQRHFAAMRTLAQQLVAARLLPTSPMLSMGMSNDFAAAIAEGATLVRVGTAIFGARR